MGGLAYIGRRFVTRFPASLVAREHLVGVVVDTGQRRVRATVR